MNVDNDWVLNCDELVLSGTSGDAKYESVKLYYANTNEFYGELNGNEIEDIFGDILKEIRDGLLSASTARIIMIQDNKFVTEEIDEDGKKRTTTYNRIK